ncbi:hypothetical protein BLS_007631 [Venturia inaequalis]|uniref:Major facilitator superfamily (MFS) profile domain-containing protein n=1 Tax=Venturia inaequalis TaxID=5025 RepID=A0A8H3U9C1_VENIN|nr:hypothetical protein BLS_007631 [Venturia inaequalis]KAE9988065.1 hypothetical protein EG328_000535 [Venturia inaequalis]
MQVHIPKFCHWIARHDTAPTCHYNPNACLLCIFNRDLQLYWRNVKSRAGFEDRHDKDFGRAAERMTETVKYAQWTFLKEEDMADCNEFMAWLVDSGFPYYARNSHSEEGRLNEKSFGGWEHGLAAMMKVRTLSWWTCHNINLSGNACNGTNIEQHNDSGSDEVGLRIQCGESERKQGESEKACRNRNKRVKRLEEFIREQMHEEAGMATAKTCTTCGVRKALSLTKTAIISAPEVLIIRLQYFTKSLYKPSKLGFKYGLWLDLSEFQTPRYRRKRKSMKYRLSSVLFHSGPASTAGHYVGIHAGPTGIWAVSDTSVRRASMRDMLATENGGEAGSRLWSLSDSRITPASLVTRRPANIPLHTLSSASRPLQREESSRSLIDDPDEKGSSTSADSDFSLWSDTGDLVDQLADQEDPLRSRLRDPLPQTSGQRRGRPHKQVRYHPDVEDNEKKAAALRKEDIHIPVPPQRKINFGERVLIAIMAPNDGPSRIHGLHGKKLIYFTTIFVSLGVFLFGYDQGVMSGIITGPHFKDYFNQPSRAEIGTMVAILEVGAFISSISIGKLGDMLGRRKTILYGSLIFIVGGALQTFANGMPMMMLGRIIAGLGVGALSTIVPVYQSEISPAHNRGKLACIEFTGNIAGYAASVWVDYGCTWINSDWSWRIPLGMQVIMGSLLAVGSLLILESPRWLLDHDLDEQGIVVIANLYGKGDIHNQKARDEYREIKMNVLLQRQEGERTYSAMFKQYHKRVFIAMSAQALAQLNGINVISYYAPLVFEQAGWVGRDAILMTGINAITYLLSTIPPWYLVDVWGRRLILLSGAVAMMVSLSAISYFIYLDIHLTPTLVVVFVMIYNAAFGYSWGPIPWLYPPEILPMSIRSKGASLSTATNWAFNWLVGEMTPILQEWIQWRLYLLHAFSCLVSFVVVYFIYPETANVRLEDMNSLFGDATTVAPTPETLAEAESLFGSARSPVPSLDLRRQGAGNITSDNAIPGLDIDPPDVKIKNGQPQLSRKSSSASNREGLGGWISNMVQRARGNGEGDSSSAQYKSVNQDED